MNFTFQISSFYRLYLTQRIFDLSSFINDQAFLDISHNYYMIKGFNKAQFVFYTIQIPKSFFKEYTTPLKADQLKMFEINPSKLANFLKSHSLFNVATLKYESTTPNILQLESHTSKKALVKKYTMFLEEQQEHIEVSTDQTSSSVELQVSSLSKLLSMYSRKQELILVFMGVGRVGIKAASSSNQSAEDEKTTVIWLKEGADFVNYISDQYFEEEIVLPLKEIKRFIQLFSEICTHDDGEENTERSTDSPLLFNNNFANVMMRIDFEDTSSPVKIRFQTMGVRDGEHELEFGMVCMPLDYQTDSDLDEEIMNIEGF